MTNLDDAKELQRLDPEDMLRHIGKMPWQCQQAWQMAVGFSLPEDYGDINKIVFSGMGSSALGAELVSSLVEKEAKLTIFTCRDYDLPAFIDGKTLLVSCSYSGMTEETLSAFRQSLKTGAKKLVITTGGKLKDLAIENNVPVFSFVYDSQPRAALGFSLMACLGILQRLGLVSDKSADVNETVKVLTRLAKEAGETTASPDNPAKKLAESLYDKLTVIYAGGILSGVAHRWKTQINENSKAWAFYEISPELNHNAVVGYQFPLALTDKVAVVLLRSASLSQPIQRSYKAIGELLKKDKISCQFVDGEGDSPLSQVMSLLLLGDYASYYLAILNQIDPSPAPEIAYIKGKIKSG